MGFVGLVWKPIFLTERGTERSGWLVRSRDPDEAGCGGAGGLCIDAAVFPDLWSLTSRANPSCLRHRQAPVAHPVIPSLYAGEIPQSPHAPRARFLFIPANSHRSNKLLVRRSSGSVLSSRGGVEATLGLGSDGQEGCVIRPSAWWLRTYLGRKPKW